MCTAILLFRPQHLLPIVLGSIRDEVRSRSSKLPEKWWSDFPNAIGGKDEVAGGTWLAVDSRQQRVAVVLNRRIYQQDNKTSTRGILPLWAISKGNFTLTAKEAVEFHPFNLLYASREACVWWRWDGEKLSNRILKPGLYMLTGKDLNDVNVDPRQQRWLPLFRDVKPPDCPDLGCAEIHWGEWLELMADQDSPFDDPSALNVKGVATKPNFGTVTAAMIAFTADGRVRYDFCPDSPDKNLWYRVL